MTNWKDYIASQGAVFSEGGQIKHFKNTPSVQENQSQLCILTQQTVLEAKGPDTVRFLQGQLSCNIDECDEGQHMPGVLCTPKGRMIASFRLINTGSSRYLMSLHRSVADNVISTLDKYSVFYKSTVTHTAPSYLCLGLMGQHVESTITAFTAVLPKERHAINIDSHTWLHKSEHVNNTYELWLPEEQLSQWWERLIPLLTPVSENSWHDRHIKATIPRVRSEYADKYTPQHLNFPSLGHISFRKGCYTGQEIVTRMQNLGQQKSHTYTLICNTANAVAPGTKLENNEGKAVGEVLESASTTDAKQNVLAVVRIDAAKTGDIRLSNDKNCHVTVTDIPYPIDPRAELQF